MEHVQKSWGDIGKYLTVSQVLEILDCQRGGPHLKWKVKIPKEFSSYCALLFHDPHSPGLDFNMEQKSWASKWP